MNTDEHRYTKKLLADQASHLTASNALIRVDQCQSVASCRSVLAALLCGLLLLLCSRRFSGLVIAVTRPAAVYGTQLCTDNIRIAVPDLRQSTGIGVTVQVNPGQRSVSPVIHDVLHFFHVDRGAGKHS